MKVRGTEGDHGNAWKRYRALVPFIDKVIVLDVSHDRTRTHYHGRVDEWLYDNDELTARDVLLILDEGSLLYGGTLEWGRKGEFWASVDIE
jgi:hypothetical protein